MPRRLLTLPVLMTSVVLLHGPAAGAQPEAAAEAFIRLAPDADGACGAPEKTELVRVSKSTQPFVHFVITNGCEADVVVSVGGFRHAERERMPDPIQQTAGNRRVQVGAGETSRTLRLRVRNDAVEGEWFYDVLVDGRVVDPRIAIDP